MFKNNFVDPQNTGLSYYRTVLSLLSESTDDYIYIWVPETGSLFFDTSIQKNYGVSNKSIYQLEDYLNIVYPPDVPSLIDDLTEVATGKKDYHEKEYRLVNKSGEKVWISCRGKVVYDETSNQHLMIGRISENALIQKADQLTGLLRTSQMEQNFSQFADMNPHFFFVIVGLDNFKNINDKYGQTFGNKIIKSLAGLIEKNVPNPYHIYRLDGDKFGIYLPAQSRNDLERFYETLKWDFSDYCHSIAENIYCTISLGASEYSSQSTEYAELYKYAESALNHAKSSGKNTMVFFDWEIYENQLFQISIQEELQRSILDNFSGFSAYYQPQVDIHTNKIVGAEALMRWTSPKHGRIPPNIFIPILEQSDLISKAGFWIIKEALKQCKEWRNYIPDFRISINLSYLQLRDHSVSQFVFECLDEYQLPGEAVLLELTESVQLENYRFFNQLFFSLRQKGVHIAIDDFGTGYSSLKYLKDLSIDQIKIDRCFVTELQCDSFNYKLVRNMIDLAHSIEINVCVEGIETAEELTTLVTLNPNLIQGYYFGHPEPEHIFRKKFIETSEMFSETDSLLYSATLLEDIVTEQPFDVDNFKNIVEEFDQIVYVSDIETHELYYINKMGRRLIESHDPIGQKCYKVLQGKQEPCSFCTNHLLFKHQFYRWEKTNPVFDRKYILKDKLITWNGRPARLEIATDITHQENVSNETKEKLKIEKTIVKCIRALNRADNLTSAINSVLQSIAEFYQADRAYIFEIDYSSKVCHNTYEWCSHGITSEIENLQNVSIDLIERWLTIFQSEPMVVIHDIDEIKESSPDEYQILKNQNISSLLVTPFRSEKNKKVSGFIGVDNPSWFTKDYALLDALSYFIIDEMKKRGLSEQLFFMSYHDALTGIYNRNCYKKDLEEFSFDFKHSVGIVYADINGLKKVNDELGHNAGDELIKHVASILISCFKGHRIYRVGGDEFVIVCKNVSEEDFLSYVEKVRAQVDADETCSVSFGQSWSNQQDDVEKLVKEADSLMYQDKDNYYQRHC
ncbi:MAG: EAL domain-containing protein [Lachnospiraceae bacterium]|nr:EAL domain-containing protein [Lachnospiraceae bacterium]